MVMLNGDFPHIGGGVH